MKRILLVLLIAFNLNFLFAQYPLPNQGEIAGGFGLTWIDNQPFYSFRINPEISFANFGVGLDLNLQFDSKGKLRKENFNETSDYLSIIRYIRYGQKMEPIYVKVGAIDYYTLGHGTILHRYNNSPSFDTRKIGLVTDLDFEKFGFESMYSDFSQGGVLGFRGYVRPLQFTDLSSIPVIGNFEFGISFAGDFNENAPIILASKNPLTNELVISKKENTLTVFGFDFGFPIVNTSTFNLKFYTDYVKFSEYGDGAATGLIANLNGLGIVNASAKLERRWNSDKFIPSYFNSLYEIERFRIDDRTNSAVSKIQQLKYATDPENGFFGELGISIMNLFQIVGSFEKLDKAPRSGILHLSTDISPKDASFVARAGYDKLYIEDGKDVFTLDDRSYLFVEAGYKPYPFVLVSLIYNWTFTPVRDKDDNVIGFEPQKKIEPRVSFIYPFDIGGK